MIRSIDWYFSPISLQTAKERNLELAAWNKTATISITFISNRFILFFFLQSGRTTRIIASSAMGPVERVNFSCLFQPLHRVRPYWCTGRKKRITPWSRGLSTMPTEFEAYCSTPSKKSDPASSMCWATASSSKTCRRTPRRHASAGSFDWRPRPKTSPSVAIKNSPEGGCSVVASSIELGWLVLKQTSSGRSSCDHWFFWWIAVFVACSLTSSSVANYRQVV